MFVFDNNHSHKGVVLTISYEELSFLRVIQYHVTVL